MLVCAASGRRRVSARAAAKGGSAGVRPDLEGLGGARAAAVVPLDLLRAHPALRRARVTIGQCRRYALSNRMLRHLRAAARARLHRGLALRQHAALAHVGDLEAVALEKQGSVAWSFQKGKCRICE